jgi:hypothetical protein
MELLNATGMQAGYTGGMDSDGRERLVVAVKGTFVIPRDGEVPRLAEKQEPLREADQFAGEPGLSAPTYESDYAPRKPRCDVVLNGSAYVPNGRPTDRVQVSLAIGQIKKSFDVVGDRVWETHLLGVRATPARPFKKMPISYGCAFGGTHETDKSRQQPDQPEKLYQAYARNPIGVGFYRTNDRSFIVGKPLPNTEEGGRPVTRPHGDYTPIAFGPIGRSWNPRREFAGKYDEDWLSSVFPFLPADFDERYHQAAPPDQQMNYPKGGEEVVLVNLTPKGRTSFRLPTVHVPVMFRLRGGQQTENDAVIDTVIIEPDEARFTLTWRASIPLRRNIFDAEQIVAGKMRKSWHRARAMGKTYYSSLGKLGETERTGRV